MASNGETETITCNGSETSAVLWADQNMRGGEIGIVQCGDAVTLLSGPSKNFFQTVEIRTNDGRVGYVPGRFVGVASATYKLHKVDAKFEKRKKKICNEHIGWSEAQCAAVAGRNALVGMTGEMVRAAWGRPHRVSTTYTAGHTLEQWEFGNDALYYRGRKMWGASYSFVYLDNNIVTAIQK